MWAHLQRPLSLAAGWPVDKVRAGYCALVHGYKYVPRIRAACPATHEVPSCFARYHLPALDGG
eukprot:CAMPEP_0185206022 /NCGR_PEP_ID=MMETSP1140-20130426/57661_1 /TAXON_ID=298111 /ORGANISM="Pavlova sp., Strain CCMP459" /LENGTH=62 /DNA_ID=CAMNT_0027773647 /DNA_START=76 /DNA_END=260 /DNA_ORIENTATION=-